MFRLNPNPVKYAMLQNRNGAECFGCGVKHKITERLYTSILTFTKTQDTAHRHTHGNAKIGEDPSIMGREVNVGRFTRPHTQSICLSHTLLEHTCTEKANIPTGRKKEREAQRQGRRKREKGIERECVRKRGR